MHYETLARAEQTPGRLLGLQKCELKTLFLLKYPASGILLQKYKIK
jgi:hypothetical protein